MLVGRHEQGPGLGAQRVALGNVLFRAFACARADSGAQLCSAQTTLMRSGAHIGSPTERYIITRGQCVGPCRVWGGAVWVLWVVRWCGGAVVR
eukprot:880234-Prymnesium_polylepis.1